MMAPATATPSLRSHGLWTSPLLLAALALCLTVTIAAAAFAADPDRVHKLCQPREFHSFRRKVCSLTKRSLGPDDYAEFIRELQHSSSHNMGQQTPAHAGAAQRQHYNVTQATPRRETVSQDRQDLQSWLQNVLVTYYSHTDKISPETTRKTPSSFRSSSHEGRKHPKSLVLPRHSSLVQDQQEPLLRYRSEFEEDKRTDRQSGPLLRILGAGRELLDSGEQTARDDGRNTLPMYGVSAVERPGNLKKLNESDTKPDIHDIIDIHLLKDGEQTFSVRPNKPNLANHHNRGSRMPTFHDYLNNEETLPEVDPYSEHYEDESDATAHSSNGLPISDYADYDTIFEPSEIFNNIDNSIPGVDEATAYNLWGREFEDVLVDKKPRRNFVGTNVGMLREHCCIHGCTLNRHFHHFQSICST